MGRGDAGTGEGWGEVSVVEPRGEGLVEVEVGGGLGARGVEGGRLVEEEVGLGRATRRGDRRRPVGELEVEEDSGHDGRIGEKRQDPHLRSAGRAQEGQDFVDAGEEHGPPDAGGACVAGGVVRGGGGLGYGHDWRC